MTSILRIRTLLAISVILSVVLSAPGVAGSDRMMKVKKLKGRDTPFMRDALAGKDGRLGLLHDVTGDGLEELVYLERKGKTLTFHVAAIADGSSFIERALGEGYPAGLGIVNIDDDEEMEFIVGFGNRNVSTAAKVLTRVFSVIFAVGVSAYTGIVQPYSYALGDDDVDLRHLQGLDADGSVLWEKLMPEESLDWENPRYRMVVPPEGDGPAAVIITNDTTSSVIGIDAEKGVEAWSVVLAEQPSPSRWSSRALLKEGRVHPVFFSGETTYILDSHEGTALIRADIDVEIDDIPTWNIFGEGEKAGFLAYGTGRDELRMLSLASGETLWTREMETIRSVIPLDRDRFMVVWRRGVKFFSSSGELLQDLPVPVKVKGFTPVFRDLDGDGSFEFIFVSGKKVVCWNPEKSEVAWSESLAGFVGGANPTELYQSFHDLDGDGWLDVPARKGSGAGRWLSGKDGEVIAEFGAGLREPIVGDWDGNGNPEVFWHKEWFEVFHPAR